MAALTHASPMPRTPMLLPACLARSASRNPSRTRLLLWQLVSLAVVAPLQAQGGALWHVKISDTSGGFPGGLDAGDQFGKAVARLDDLDGDGLDDLVVGAYRDDDGGTDRGAVWILFLQADGTVRDAAKISATTGGFGGPLDDGDNFGNGAAKLGDLDGDGRPELAVGAVGDDDGGTDRGAVWILSLESDGSVHAASKISDTAGGLAAPLPDFGLFGVSVAALGDVDGDGLPDLGVGAARDSDGGPSRGAVHVLFLAADGTVQAEQKISATAGGFTGPLQDGDQFGVSTAGLGDFDGDGVPDLLVGAPREDTGGTERGGAWLLRLAGDGTVEGHVHYADGTGDFGGALQDGDWFGTGVTGLGDVDGDGVDDVAVGAGFSDAGAMDTGALWVLLLRADGSVRHEQAISGISGGLGVPIAADSIFGWSLAGLGDFDGDGVPDLAVGSNRDDDGGTNQGAAWLVGLDAGPWTVLGGGTSGVAGVPVLAASGALTAGSPLAVDLVGTAPNALLLAWVAFTPTPLAHAGGTLHAFPPAAEFLLAADVEGRFAADTVFPAGVAPGVELYLQFLCQDTSVAPGLSLSHGVRGSVP